MGNETAIFDLDVVQEAIREADVDAWLFAQFHGRDPLATRVLALPADSFQTRRWCYLIPAEGEPRGLIHAIEPHALEDLPGSRRRYRTWQELDAGLDSLLDGIGTVAMQYSPQNRVPYVAMVDAGTVEVVRERGAEPRVMWVDMPERPTVIWPDLATRDTVWRIPAEIKAAMKEADLLISHVFDLSSEEHLKELSETLREYELPMVRNMASTAPLLMSDWARTPHDLIAEIRYRMGELVVAGEPWELTHSNGSHLRGIVGPGPKTRPSYVYWRRDGFYRPFPDGIYPAVNPVDCEGVFIFDRMMPIWARKIGLPPLFSGHVGHRQHATCDGRRVVYEKHRIEGRRVWVCVEYAW